MLPSNQGKRLEGKGKAAAVLKHDLGMRDFFDVFRELRITASGKEDPKWTENKILVVCLRRVQRVHGSTLHPTGCRRGLGTSYDEAEHPLGEHPFRTRALFCKSSSLPRGDGIG
jgi:hypothetical protein